MASAALAVVGHNNPPEPTPFELARNTVDALYEEAKHWLDGQPIANPQQADSVSLLMDSLRRAEKEADEARKAEAKPFDEGKAEVQARYNPILKRAKTGVEGCRAALTPWLRKVEDDKREAARLERERAEQARQAAETAIRAAAPDDLEARERAEELVSDAKRAAASANRAEKDRAQAMGGTRATALRSDWVASLADPFAAAQHYWGTNQEACEAFFLSLAEADVRAGKRQIPGVLVTEEKRAV